ncbi:MAG: hypothetical protein REH83_01505, partial [Rickettsiella sp.]|nr:hypothetical protein [Rickettsiella sp.]
MQWLTWSKDLAIASNNHIFIKKIDFLQKEICIRIQNTNKFFSLMASGSNKEKKITESIELDFYKKFKLHLESFYYTHNLPLDITRKIYTHLNQFIEIQVNNLHSENKLPNAHSI